MQERLSPDHPFFIFMNKLGDFILLNILFILTSLPVITIGASMTALYTSMDRISQNEEAYIIQSYFQYFTQNFKKATILWITYLLAALPIAFSSSWLSVYGNAHPLYYIPYIFYLMVFSFTLLYTFPLQATFENTVLRLLCNSLLTALRHLPSTILLMFLFYIPITFTLLFPEIFYITFLFWTMIGFSFLVFFTGYFYRSIFRQYIVPSAPDETSNL